MYHSRGRLRIQDWPKEVTVLPNESDNLRVFFGHFGPESYADSSSFIYHPTISPSQFALSHLTVTLILYEFSLEVDVDVDISLYMPFISISFTYG